MSRHRFVPAVKELIGEGILGAEECPNPDYWHWPVLDEERLPEWLKANYETYDEIRWYGG